MTFIDFFLHLDVVLKAWVLAYPGWIYLMLFVVVFIETGAVVTPFLPGDSLLFAAGAIAAVPRGGLSVWLLLPVLFAAAALGDTTNYSIGRAWGRRILDSGRFSRVITQERIVRTELFFAKHGGKTITFARFFPVIRTFAPFLAGISRMGRGKFTLFNLAGAAAWVALFVGAGYFLGRIPFVAKNLELIVIGIISLTIVPATWEAIRARRARKRTAEAS